MYMYFRDSTLFSSKAYFCKKEKKKKRPGLFYSAHIVAFGHFIVTLPEPSNETFTTQKPFIIRAVAGQRARLLLTFVKHKAKPDQYTGCFLCPDIKRFCLTFTIGPDRIWFCLIQVQDFFLQ